MRTRRNCEVRSRNTQAGSTFVVVLWIAFGLVSLTLYFGSSMVLEYRAADNRVAGIVAEQAIAGAARYVGSMLAAFATNGAMPDPSVYLNQRVPVGEAHFWLIGRDTNNAAGPGQLFCGLVDEGSKINLNTASSNMLVYLPRNTADLTSAILDWRSTNGSGTFQTWYAMQPVPYQTKSAPFETVDELRLLYGADLDTLVGEDVNRNGILDPNENDENKSGQLDPGLLDCLTIYSREPNTNSAGVARVNIRAVSGGSSGPLPSLLQTTFGEARANQILAQLGLVSSGPPQVLTFNSPLQFFRRSGMTADEFGKIASAITVKSGQYIEGRVNINTASAWVLACLPGISSNPDLAQTLVNYRQSNPASLTSVAWLVDALGRSNNSTLNALQAVDCITTEAYQFSADIAAVGPHNRGYRRVRFVFDTSEGTPKIIYRQDLTHLGWALGKEVRQDLMTAPGVTQASIEGKGFALGTLPGSISGRARPLWNF